MAKRKPARRDGGLSAKQRQQLSSAIRQVWSWSYARRVCIARATDKNGFGKCELCKRRVPKLFADHIEPCGDVLSDGFIARMFRASKFLQALCKRCHDRKTREERKEQAIKDSGF